MALKLSWLHESATCAITQDPHLEGPCAVQCSAGAILKFLSIFEKGVQDR